MKDLIDVTIHDESKLENAVQRAREQNIIIPTFKQMINPDLIPDSITKQLDQVGLWDLNPLNLFRINWHNEAKEIGGKFGGTNYLVLPKELTGIDARIVILLGKWFPTGSHKVGAAYACLVPRLVTGQFDPTSQKAVWPSTGNYCRGGAYDSNLLACDSIAILPEGMSKERFDWLADVAGETIRTPGSESNVKEIFDKCWELRNSGQALSIFNQFDEFGNYLWHYEVTSRAMMEALKETMGPKSSIAVTTSVFLALWIQGTCLSPIPSMRCAPNPLFKRVGHCNASLATILENGNCSFMKSPQAIVPPEPVLACLTSLPVKNIWWVKAFLKI